MAKETLSLTLSSEEAKKLRAALRESGFRRGKFMDFTGFAKAISNGDLIIIKQKNALNNCVNQLIKKGHYSLALKFEDIEGVNTGLPKILKRISELIKKKQAFRLEYLDVTNEPFFLDCCFAQISTYEAREYLEVHHINTLTSSDNLNSALQHNRCLLINQIPESSQISELNNVDWQDLATIDVTYSLIGNSILSYVPELGDLTEKISVLGQDTKLKIQTKISNEYWFIRKILKFGGSAEILYPDFLKIKFKNEIQEISKLYSSVKK